MIDHLKDFDDIAYIRQDIRLGLVDAGKIAERLELCQNGENKENKNYYKGIKKLYIDKGITKSDVEAYKNWLNTVAKEKLNSKVKELREKEKINESVEVTLKVTSLLPSHSLTLHQVLSYIDSIIDFKFSLGEDSYFETNSLSILFPYSDRI